MRKARNSNDYSRSYAGFESPTGHQMAKPRNYASSSVFLVFMRLRGV
nr:MAG TPA: hypothetical protein [Caudoviricetes sp.]